MDKEKQKILGAFYTPLHTVKYMVNKIDWSNKKGNLLEPSGGDGAFVSVVLEEKLLNKNNIHVWDINKEVKPNLEKLGVNNITIKDTLLETDFNTSSLLSIKKFSYIIGNPPYLNKQSAYIKKNKHILGEIFKEIGANDTYAMFLYLGCRLLKDDGQLCFIISDTFLTLGIHKKLRKFLLKNYTINEITLCSKKLFKEKGVLVNTCIMYLSNKTVTDSHDVVFNDCRDNEPNNYNGKKYHTKQKNILKYPDYVFDFNGGAKLLNKITELPKMVDLLEGGLGMHTTNNNKFLAIINYNGIRYASNGGVSEEISVNKVDNKTWKFYHKKGGNAKYFLPAEYAIKWEPVAVANYKMPKEYNVCTNRQGFIISGICSNLTARLSTSKALWESNKAMCFFPKNSQKYPSEFFIGILNSDVYNKMIKLLNHTNSLQIRDIKKLPMPSFSGEEIQKITKISKNIIAKLQKDLNYNFNEEQKEINLIVNKYFK